MIKKLSRYYPYGFGVLTVCLGLGLIVSALQMEAYTLQSIAAAWAGLRPLAVLWLALGMAGLLLCPVKEQASPNKKTDPILKPLSHKKGLRLGLYGLALALVVLGVINGGLKDVLYKAITICTECIGLG